MTPACNICGSTEFRDFNNRPKAICSRCGAYERTRVLKLFLDRLNIGPQTSVLHIAPERGLYAYLKPRVGRYVPCDIDTERYAHIPEIRRIDLCDASTFEGLGTFDLILHNHVIEHVPCNWTIVMLRLHRLLSDDGRHMFSMPIYGKAFEEDLSDIGDPNAPGGSANSITAGAFLLSTFNRRWVQSSGFLTRMNLSRFFRLNCWIRPAFLVTPDPACLGTRSFP